MLKRIGIDHLCLIFLECLEEVQRQREIFQREEAARRFLSNEDASVPMNLTNTLKKLNAEQQPIIYFIGGMDLLNQLIKDGWFIVKKAEEVVWTDF